MRADAPAAPWRWRALRTPWGCAEPLWLRTPRDALPGASDQALAGIPQGDLPGPQEVLSGGTLAPMAAALPPPERMLCRRSDSHMDGCGPMEQVDGVCAHVFCLVSSPRLPAPFPDPLTGTWSPQDCVIPTAVLAGCHLLLLRSQHSLPTMVPISLP